MIPLSLRLISESKRPVSNRFHDFGIEPSDTLSHANSFFEIGDALLVFRYIFRDVATKLYVSKCFKLQIHCVLLVKHGVSNVHMETYMWVKTRL